MALKEYNQKRNFKATPEPAGKASKENKLRFVVQRHQASRLHYDFRLELDGVLKSWAVPKGPSLNPADKRLAMMVEDHPVGYIDFAGEIPADNYGAGTVEIWDNGNYTPVNEKHEEISHKEAIAALSGGQLKFALRGSKLQGEFVLVQLKKAAKDNSWLLIKHRDEHAVDKDYNSEDYLETKTKKKPSTSTPKKVKKADSAQSKPPEVLKEAGAVKKKEQFLKPMLATLADKPFDDDNWIFELKWDGYRAIAEWQHKKLELYSRNGISFTTKYIAVADAVKKLGRDVVLDGEIVLLNEDDKPDFQKLQQFEDNKHLPIIYYVFDLLFLDGKDLRSEPLIQRKKLLAGIIPEDPVLKYCDHIEREGTDFFHHVTELNLEGIIAKQAESRYHCGIRTREWLKIKHVQSREAIIAGYTAPRGGRKHFGALILAQYDKDELQYLGHTGTGFTEKALNALWTKMQPLVVSKSPFKKKIKVNEVVTWLNPQLICQVKFTEQTEGGMLRHPVYMGLRADKEIKEVQQSIESPVSVTETKSPSVAIEDETITVDKHKVALTNLKKVYWPSESGPSGNEITKGDLIKYYQAIAPYILPYLKDRALSLKRNPNGILDEGFFHKDAGEAAPSWVKKTKVYSESTDKVINYIVCNNTASLLYIANLGCIEINPWNSTTKNPDKPTYLVIDLDPSDKNSFDEVIKTALVVKAVLDKAGVACYCKTSGASGLHVYIPMSAKYSYEEAKDFGEIIAMTVQQELPEITSVERSLKKRGNKIYIDFLQNRKGQTLAAPYSVRPQPGATVSTPLEWKEVKPGLRPSMFTIQNIIRRLEKKGDLFEPVIGKGIDLHKALQKLGEDKS